MKAFAALFENENDEADYKGYQRVEFDYVDEMFLKPIGLTFPACEDESVAGLQIVAVYTKPSGGERLCETMLAPSLSAKKGNKLCVILFCNLPEALHPIARATFHAWIMQELKAEDIHPKVYEAVNDELSRLGVPVIPCVRGAKATWDVKMSNMPSLRDIGIEGPGN